MKADAEIGEAGEPGFLSSPSAGDRPLAESMVFTLEPKFVFGGEAPSGSRSSCVIRADRMERLTHAPDELRSI